MLEILHFLLGSIWTWLGAVVLLALVVDGIVHVVIGMMAIVAAVLAPGRIRAGSDDQPPRRD